MRNLTMRWTAAACCALSACLCAPAAARAQAGPPAAPAEGDVPSNNTRAAQLYREGNAAFVQKRWAEAELLYLKAWALVRSFDIAANLGQVQLQLKKPRSAATFLAFSVRTAPPSVKPEQLARMREFLEEARRQVGAVRVQVTNVPDAEVLVDGERVPAEEVKHELYVRPGRHEVVVRRAGYREVVVPVLAFAGSRETIGVVMKPVAAEEKAPAAEAKVHGAEEKTPAPGGTAPLAERAPVERSAASEAELAKLTEAPVALPVRSAEEHAGGPRKAVLIGGAATAGAAAVAGVVFTVLAVTKGNDAEQLRDSVVRDHGAAACSRPNAPTAACADVKDAFDVHRRWTNTAFWSFVGAGAVGAGTLIYGLTTRPPKQGGRVLVTPLVGANSVGISVGGVL